MRSYRRVMWIDGLKRLSRSWINKISVDESLMWHPDVHVVDVQIDLKTTKVSNIIPDWFSVTTGKNPRTQTNSAMFDRVKSDLTNWVSANQALNNRILANQKPNS